MNGGGLPCLEKKDLAISIGRGKVPFEEDWGDLHLSSVIQLDECFEKKQLLTSAYRIVTT